VGRIARILSFVRSEINGAKVSDVKSDPGGGPNTTAQHFQPAGDDAHPLPGDYVATSAAAGTGRETAVGYLDPANEQKAAAGEKRIYARDPSSGDSVVEVWLKSDSTAVIINANGSVTLAPDGSVEATNANGSITLGADGGTTVETPAATFTAAASGSIKGENGAGVFELTPGGDFVVNGVTIGTDGSIVTPTSVATPSAVINGVEAASHTHPQGNDSAGNTEQDTGPMQ
jgi:hypothetical protein